MEVSRLTDVPGETCLDIFRGDPGGDIGKHIDAALAFGIHRNPGERGELSFTHLDTGQIHAVVLESFGDGAAVFVIAYESDPAGLCAQASDLSEVVGGDPAGVHFKTSGVDLLVRADQLGHDGEEIHCTTAEPDHIHLLRHKYSLK